MIHQDSFSKEWIFGFKRQKQFKNVNPSLLEKTIHALALLEQLTMHEMDFIFKGGTSLMLLLSNSKRFSIDIDIITQMERDTLEVILERVVQNSHFEKYELDIERSYKSGVPKAHYAFYYPSNFNKAANFILLDILFTTHAYPEITTIPIENFWLKTKNVPQMVKTPTVNAIIGDKLTAFAPQTTGIPYFRNETSMNVEIIKQLFDLNYLILEATDFNIAYQSFKQNAQKEILFRSLNDTTNLHTIIDDIVETALLLARRQRNNEHQLVLFNHLKDGVLRFKSYSIDGSFHIEKAIEAAAKIALLAACFKTEKIHEFDRTLLENPPLIQSQEFNFLNKYRKIKNGTFSYWLKTLRVFGIEDS